MRRVTWLTPPLCTEDLVEKNAMEQFVSARDRKNGQKEKELLKTLPID